MIQTVAVYDYPVGRESPYSLSSFCLSEALEKEGLQDKVPKEK